MPNKPFPKLNILDQEIRKVWRPNMMDDVQLTIELICGFELFNTRPYHNYETWSNGYRVTDKNGIKVEAEDLDDAINIYVYKRREYLTNKGE